MGFCTVIEVGAMGFLSALGIFIIMAKVNLDFFARYHWQTDIAVSVGLTFLFFGTFSGVMTALVAGIFISLFLFIARYFLGY